jgi:transcriptional regulator of acetoin/glycerol metabolism
MILADDKLITLDDLPREVLQANIAPVGPGCVAASCGSDLASLERNHIITVLQREQGNKAAAARALGIHRRKLYRLIERYGIET